MQNTLDYVIFKTLRRLGLIFCKILQQSLLYLLDIKSSWLAPKITDYFDKPLRSARFHEILVTNDSLCSKTWAILLEVCTDNTTHF